jgi:hypothetical protein
MTSKEGCVRQLLMADSNQPPDPNIKVIVFRTSDAATAAFAESVFQDANIDCWVRGRTLHDVMGWDQPGLYSSALGPVEFHVREPDAAEALELLAPLNPSVFGGKPEN